MLGGNFSLGVARHCNSLPGEAMDTTSLEAFKTRLDEAPGNLILHDLVAGTMPTMEGWN